MRKFFISLIIALAIGNSYGEALSLDSCQIMAKRNHPLLRQTGLIDQIAVLRKQSIEISNLPQFDLSAKATWQSEVTQLALNIPGFTRPTPVSKDQYKVLLDVRQKIFDGGVANKREAMEEANRLVSRQQNETELYKIKETVNTLYFNALIVQENLKIVDLKRELIDAKIKNVHSSVENGVSLPNDLDQLKAELIVTDQQKTELLSTRSTTIALLEIVIGTPIGTETSFTPPTISETTNIPTIQRPEIALFNLEKSKLDKNAEILTAMRKPYVYAFGQAGYGRPGLNMLNNNFGEYYIVGAGMSWNIFDWHETHHEKAVIKLQQDLIDTNLDQFNRSIKMALSQEENSTQKLAALINTDKQLVTLKDQIAKRSAVALENGMITSADYLRDLNALLQTKANLETRKIQWIQSLVNYRTIQGDLGDNPEKR